MSPVKQLAEAPHRFMRIESFDKLVLTSKMFRNDDQYSRSEKEKLSMRFDGPRTKDSLIEFANKNLQMNELQRE